MNDCPSIRLLLERPTPEEISCHVDACFACQAVVTMIADHDAPDSEKIGCAVAELQIAAREAGVLSDGEIEELKAHLSACPSCQSAGQLD